MLHKKKPLILAILLLAIMPILSAIPYDKGSPINHDVDTNTSGFNVNNSQYLQGYSPVTLRSWIQDAFNSVYCTLTGCDMAGDIDMNGNNIYDATTINATAFFGDGSGLTGVVTGYPHDQFLNTTDNVIHNTLNLSCNGIATNESCLNVTGDAYFDTIHSNDAFFGANTVYIGDAISLSAGNVGAGATLNITGGNVSADYYYGSGQFLTDINLTDVTIDGGIIIANNITALEELTLNDTTLFDWGDLGVQEYTQYVIITGNGSGQTTALIDFEITQIIVNPLTSTTTYNFEAVESLDGSMIDRNRIEHEGEWNIYKEHLINDQVNFTISNASVNEQFNITIKYLDNYI